MYPTYIHICTGYRSFELVIHTDTSRYRLIQLCMYAICTVHIRYELVCILCISMCISVCMFDRYSTDIPVHIRVICVCIFGRYAHAGSLMFVTGFPWDALQMKWHFVDDDGKACEQKGSALRVAINGRCVPTYTISRHSNWGIIFQV